MSNADALSTSFPRTEELLQKLSVWAGVVMQHPEFREFNLRKLKATVDLYGDVDRKPAKNFRFPEPLSIKHDAMMSFYYLYSDCDRLQSYHLYFRRFPFRSGEMLKHEHLQNMFDMFFAGFYVVQQRLETCLNSLMPLVDAKPDVGRLLKSYKKKFKDELRPRHQLTHERPYDDLTLDQLLLAAQMRSPAEQRAFYRRETQRCAKIAQRRAHLVRFYVEAVAEFILLSPRLLDWDNFQHANSSERKASPSNLG